MTVEDSAWSQAEGEAMVALTHYELPGEVQVHLLSDGLTRVVRVDAAETPYALRIHRAGYRTPENTRAEDAYVCHLADTLSGTSIEVPVPVPTRDGALVVPMPDGRHADLLTWVGGSPRRLEDLDGETVEALGRTLALLHRASERYPSARGLPRWDADTMFSAQASPYRPVLTTAELLSPSDRADLDEIAARTRSAFADLDEQWGVVHFDYILGNTHVSEVNGSWRIGVVDFSDCGIGNYVYDLCPLLGNLAGFPAGTYNHGYPQLREALLQGYRSVRALPAAWERHLPVLMAA